MIRELVELFRGKERVSLYIEGGGGGGFGGRELTGSGRTREKF